MEEEPRPIFPLIDPRALTIDAIVHMFREMTGREPTEEELAEAKAELEGAK
jgi:hypothetical protein